MLKTILLGAAAIMNVGSIMEASPKTVPPARDGNIAIEQELCAARRAADLDAYDLFIARHPQHPLRPVAERERAALATRSQQR